MNLSRKLLLLLPFMLAAGAVLGAEPTPAKTPKPPTIVTDAMPAVIPPAPVDKAADRAAAPASASKAAAGAAPAGRPGRDRLDLDTTVVTGNRELPKVLYIVPWKRSDLGDLPQQPLNSLLDDVLTPVDRDVFRREVTYYGAIADSDSAATSAPASSAAGSEK